MELRHFVRKFLRWEQEVLLPHLALLVKNRFQMHKGKRVKAVSLFQVFFGDLHAPRLGS